VTPETDLVHTVDYRENFTWDFGMGAKVKEATKRMLCGVTIKITDGDLVDIPGALVLRPFLHARDGAACLGCLVTSPEAHENEAEG
jgi:hypothetical protein